MNIEDDMDLGQKIARFRKLRGLTQAELAASLDVHQTQIARWETGRSQPRREYFKQLCSALEISEEQLRTSEPHDFGELEDEELRSLLFQVPSLSGRQQETLKNILQDMVQISQFQAMMEARAS